MESEAYSGITRFVTYWADAPMVRQTYDAFVQEAEAENDGVIDAAKCMAECCCRRLIEEFEGEDNEILKQKRVTLPELMAETNRVLKIDDGRQVALRKLAKQHFELAKALRAEGLYADISEAARDKVNQLAAQTDSLANELSSEIDHETEMSRVVSKYFKMGEELAKLRNAAGPLSHGRAAFLEPLSTQHRLNAVQTADSIVDFYHQIFTGKQKNLQHTRLPYEHFERENTLIDSQGAWDVQIDHDPSSNNEVIVMTAIGGLKVDVPLSKFLFDNDRETYAELLNILRSEAFASSEHLEEEHA